MHSHGYNWRDEPQGTAVSSVLLLLVFVAAAAFLVGMVWLKPWDDDTPTPAPEAQQQAPSEAEPPAVEASAP